MTYHARALDKRLLQMRAKPGRIPRRAPVVFMNATEKACYVDGAAREEARLPEIMALASVLRRLPPDHPKPRSCGAVGRGPPRHSAAC